MPRRKGDALAFLHDHNLIHRDIKPSNVIFVKDAPKFADIGLVTEAATRDGDVSYLGTHGYIAPEGPGHPTADIFSLGKLLYVAGMGMEINLFPTLPESLLDQTDDTAFFAFNKIVLKACESNPRSRYQSAEQLRVALMELQQRLASNT